MLDEKDFELLHKHVDGIASTIESKQVETKLESSAVWRKELDTLNEMEDYVKGIEKREVFRAQLQTFHQNYIAEDNKEIAKKRFLLPRQWWSIAASFALIAAFFFYNEYKGSDDVFLAFNESPAWEYTQKSADSELSTAEKKIAKAYQAEDYSQVLELFTLLEKKSQKEYLEYKGVSQLNTGDTEGAIETFKSLIETTTQAIQKDKFHWYLALSYLKKNDKLSTRTTLQKIVGADKYYRKKADKLLKVL